MYAKTVDKTSEVLKVPDQRASLLLGRAVSGLKQITKTVKSSLR
jgi:hypothetical protein